MATPDVTADELAIRNLVAAFSDAVNRRDSAALRALFVPDGGWTVPGMGTAEGREAIAARLDGLLGGFPFLVQFAHQGEVRVDGDRAAARWYIEELARAADGSGSHFIGTYHDTLSRTDEGWRFVVRRFDFLYRGRTDLGGKTYSVPDLGGSWTWTG